MQVILKPNGRMSSPPLSLTYWRLTPDKKGRNFADDIGKVRLFQWNLLQFVNYLNAIYRLWSMNKVSINWGNGLASNKWQAIQWINDDQILQRSKVQYYGTQSHTLDNTQASLSNWSETCCGRIFSHTVTETKTPCTGISSNHNLHKSSRFFTSTSVSRICFADRLISLSLSLFLSLSLSIFISPLSLSIYIYYSL